MALTAAAIAGAAYILLGGALMLAIAAWLVSLGRKPANLAFAAFLALRGMDRAYTGVNRLLENPGVDAAIDRFDPLTGFLAGLALLYFACVFPWRRGRLGTSPHGALAISGVAAAYTVAFVALNDLFGTESTPGILGVTFNLALWYSIGILILAPAIVRAPAGPSRSAGFLVLLGMAMAAAYGVTRIFLMDITSGLPYPTLGLRMAYVGTEVAGLLLLVAAAILVAAAVRGDGGLRREVRTVLLVALVPVAHGVAYTLGDWGRSGNALLSSSGALWQLALPILALYALLRHQLFGLDVKVKWTIRQSTIGAIFIAVFFVVSEGAQELFSEQIGPMVGVVAAGALVFALAPLQRVAERVANAAMPDVKPAAEMTDDERARTYREMAMAAWSDGSVTADERRMLDRLRATLGLDAEQASVIEAEALTSVEAATAR